MLKGKVVDIVDNRTVAINIGANHGVEMDMIFQILSKEEKEIKDIDSGEILGKLKVPKIKVKVTFIDSKLSLAETYEYERTNIGGMNPMFSVSNLFSPPKYVKEYKTFDMEPEKKQEISEESSIVKVGDIVEQVTGPLS